MKNKEPVKLTNRDEIESKDQLTQESGKRQYVLLTGRGRSGTTWLGQILNTYEHCSYKYEPFLPSKSTPYYKWRDDLIRGSAEDMRLRFDSLCLGCYHQVDMPPFPPKSFRSQNPKLLHLLYGLGTRIKGLRFIYEWYGRSPLSSQTPILIKDVNFPNELLPPLVDALHPDLIAVVRNPFSNIASYFKGVELGLFDSKESKAQAENLIKAIKASGQEQLFKYCDILDGMSMTKLAAVRWRLQVEPLVKYAEAYDRGLVVVYDDLCQDPHGKVAEIFNFLGWKLESATQDFINASTSGEANQSKDSKAYYSVYRDPRESLSKWKKQLTKEQVADIASVVSDSPVKDLWSDLPL
jgi:hypothetical protein